MKVRPVLNCAIVMAAIACVAVAAPPGAVTIVLDFQGPHSDRSIAEMKLEFEGIMQESRVAFDFRTKAQAEQESFANLVVVRFKGKCILEPVGYLYDERGPLAFTFTTNGEVRPYSEVACDKVTASVRSAMWGGDFSHADLLLGRALARVMAHEVVHILSKSGDHARTGIAKPALSGRQLIAPVLKLNPADLERMYFEP
jgi:hypothetical protein